MEMLPEQDPDPQTTCPGPSLVLCLSLSVRIHHLSSITFTFATAFLHSLSSSPESTINRQHQLPLPLQPPVCSVTPELCPPGSLLRSCFIPVHLQRCSVNPEASPRVPACKLQVFWSFALHGRNLMIFFSLSLLGPRSFLVL